MKKFYITIIMALLPILIFSQGENDNWYFGNLAGVNFAGSVPVALSNSQQGSVYSAGTVSDSNGNLLFYTNGGIIMNRDHQYMDNGFDLIPGGGLASQLSIVKHPGNPNQYFVFNTPYFGSNSDATYSIVDMSLGSTGLNLLPLGRVLDNYKAVPLKNDQGSSYNAYGVTVIPHADHNSYWVLLPSGNKLFSYLINTQGLSTNPVTSNINMPVPGPTIVHNGRINASPEIKAIFSNYVSISVWNNSNETRVLSYNNASGQLTNNFSLNISTLFPTYVEFNKDASVMYLGSNGNTTIYAVDLVSSITTPIYNQIYNNPNLNKGCWGIQRNKYNDIYVNFDGYGYLSKINNPDIYGGSSLNLNEIYLAGQTTTYSLPPIVYINHPLNPCNNNILLNMPEINNTYTYQVSDHILTETSYEVDAGQDITMKAGNYIILKPDTYIKSGAQFLAKIEGCGTTTKKQNVTERGNHQKISLNLDLRGDLADDNSIKIHPNPVSDFLTIQSASPIDKVELYDLSGKNIEVKLNNNTIDVKNIPAGAYLISIQNKNGKSTKKFIKK